MVLKSKKLLMNTDSQTGNFFMFPTDNSSNAYTSIDGIHWDLMTTSFPKGLTGWFAGAYLKDKYILCDALGNGGIISSDGLSWTNIDTKTEAAVDITLGKDKLVIPSTGVFNTINYCCYSLDGIVWNRSTLPIYQKWISIVYGDGKFLMSCYENSNKYLYSSDAISWNVGTFPSARTWFDIVYVNNKFIALSGSPSISNVYAYSTDGINWTQATLPASSKWRRIVYGNGKFIITSESENNDIYLYSSDGLNWSQATLPKKKRWWGGIYGNKKFLLYENNGDNSIAHSSDGINWEITTTPVSYFNIILGK